MPGSRSSNPDAAGRFDEPLDLTVHALPGPREMEEAQRTSRRRLKMFMVLLICAAPVIAFSAPPITRVRGPDHPGR